MSDTLRRKVLAALESTLKKRDLELVQGHMKPARAGLESLLDLRVGFWAKKGDYGKPRRWLVHVKVKSPNQSIDVEFPPFAPARIIGAVSAVSKNRRKAILTFRVVPLFKAKKEIFELTDWEWLLWMVMAESLSPSLGNSAVVRDLNVPESTVVIGGKTHNLLGVGLVGIVSPENELTFPVGDGQNAVISYGMLSEIIAEVIRKVPSTGREADMANRP